MTDILAAALSAKILELPFVPAAYGLARTAEEPQTIPGTNDTRLIRYPVPVTPPEVDCSGVLQLLPNAQAGAAFFFEDEGTSLGGTTAYREFTATLRLVGWLNTARLSEPVPYATLLASLARQMEGKLVVPGLNNVNVKATNLASGDGATILSRYTLTDDTRALLRAPYVFFGITLKATGYLLAPTCAELPSLEAAPVC